MTDEDLTASRIARAEALTDLGRYEQAIELLTTIPQTSPDVAVSVNCLLAFAHVKLNNPANRTRARGGPSRRCPTTPKPCTG